MEITIVTQQPLALTGLCVKLKIKIFQGRWRCGIQVGKQNLGYFIVLDLPLQVGTLVQSTVCI